MRILLATDGSSCSDAALETLIKQLRPEGAEVHVLEAVDTVKLGPAAMSGRGSEFADTMMALLAKSRDEATDSTQRSAERLRRAGYRTRSTVREGDPKSVILEYATEWHPDLIFVGSHNRKGLDRFFLGSVSEAVARRAPCSVQIVRVPDSRAA
jgi:nucleotide-binding universal stress UspA family protein